MPQALLLTTGTLLGAAASVVVQLVLREHDRRRDVRDAARAIYAELEDVAAKLINGEAEALAKNSLAARWVEHRAAFGNLIEDDWRVLDDAVMRVLHPEHFAPAPRSSNPTEQLDRAFMVLENLAQLPASRRSYA